MRAVIIIDDPYLDAIEAEGPDLLRLYVQHCREGAHNPFAELNASITSWSIDAGGAAIGSHANGSVNPLIDLEPRRRPLRLVGS